MFVRPGDAVGGAVGAAPLFHVLLGLLVRVLSGLSGRCVTRCGFGGRFRFRFLSGAPPSGCCFSLCCCVGGGGPLVGRAGCSKRT